MSHNRNVIHLFLASPSDVQAEREVVTTVVDEVTNGLAAQLNLTVVLQRWELVSPAFGRPQELINPAVDSCDIFLGILFKRWGQSTGAHDSGFLEEFERAVQRRKRTGTPEIWMSFKTLSSSDTADPGQQLSQVLAFRKRLETSNELMYAQFDSELDFERKCRTWLTKYLLERRGVEKRGLPEASKGPEPSPPLQGAPSQATAPLPAELRDAAARIATLLQTSDERQHFDDAFALPHISFIRLGL